MLNLPFFAEMITETGRLKPNEFVQIAPSDETLKSLKLKDPFGAILVAVRRYVKGQKLPLKVERRTLIDDSSAVPTRRSVIILRRTR